MRTRDTGVRCLYISAQEGHLDVVKALLEAGGGRELVMLTAQWSELPLYRTSTKPWAGLEAAGDAWQSAGVSLHEISILKRG